MKFLGRDDEREFGCSLAARGENVSSLSAVFV
jgi:hypothetical protein